MCAFENGEYDMKKLIIVVLWLLSISFSYGEDIDLYIGDVAKRTGNRPQVLIIFDNSGSMNTSEIVKQPYDSNKNYDAVNGLSKSTSKYIYYTKGAGINNTTLSPDDSNEKHRFLDAINSCSTARERLNSVGFYTGHLREYKFQGNSGSWQEIPGDDGSNIKVIDCEDDVDEVAIFPDDNEGELHGDGSVTPIPNGYPIDGLGSNQSPIYYTGTVGNSNVIWTGEVITLYTDNYLRWSHSNSIPNVYRARLDIAKDTVTDLIESAPSIDFGLQIFNIDAFYENQRDGGRVVFGIQEMTKSARKRLVDIIDLELDGETNTPLCETLYEARRYFGGLSVDFGDDDSKPNYYSYTPNTPPRDTSIETNKVYKTPYSSCSNEVFVILITDGTPTLDNAADNYIKSLPGIGGSFNVNGWKNYLPALAGWMKNNDLNTNLPGIQTSTLFTIGFGQDAINGAAPVLTEAAKLGGGQYYPANDPSSLLSSLQSALALISRVNATFTAPSVATNNFDRTQTLNSVYYAMFLPDRGPRWQGNIKKLKVENGAQKDRTGANAINSDGNISDTAKTYWSTATKPDGNEVDQGGVAEMLRNKTNRVIYSDLGVSGALITFDQTNAENAFGSATALASEMGIPKANLGDLIAWAKGTDVDDADGDGSVTDVRPDVFGDPLHSKPLVVNYGGSSSNQDVRIIVGTNAGALHMFQDNGNTVDETWAFMPKEFFKNYAKLRENFTSTSKLYGVDGSATLYTYDSNGDGSIVSTDGDKAWVFFGLRRGGNSYYGVDISVPNTPKLLWHIDSTTTGFSELGQTWSKPKIAFSELNKVNGTAQPVLLFGGGYAISKDSAGVGGNDSVGRAVYMVDAKTGTLKWSMTPATSSSANTHYAGTDSIPSAVGILDSNGDGLIDRVYAGDTGGNVWRIDMPGSSPNSSTEPWTAFKLAELGNVGTSTSDTDDRRFFSEPSIVRTIITATKETSTTDVNGITTKVITRQEQPYDAVLIGSGDRSTPLATNTDDKFFMIRDKNIATQSYTGSTSAPIPPAIKVGDLYDYTNDPFGQTLTSQQRDTLELAVTSKSGWFINLTGSGEKSTAAAIAIDGFAYFTSFQPASGSANTCQVDPVSGFLYAVDLTLGTKLWINNVEQVNRKILSTTGTIETPQLIITQDTVSGGGGSGTPTNKTLSEIRILAGKIIIPLGITIDTWRTYMYVTE
ncbi:MAG: rRNA (guanine-N1)-methyltransferase [Gammaproteobacteria bacterium]|nr:MAG: rRNA (guanine-N1)-methyltransferase [Gammaproteobacteria bacterium]